MSQTEIGIIGIVVLLFLLAMGTHVGFTLIIVGFFGFAVIGGFNAALSNVAILTFDRLNNFDFAVLPLFMLMSTFVSQSGIARDAYETARAWFGQLRGGLAMATVGASGLFAACSGSSFAGTVVMGHVAYPEMKRLGYSTSLSSGVIAAGGTLGSLIPPSMGFVLIGILAELSIGKLFMAGILPGITEILFYIGTIFILAKLNPAVAPPTAKTSWREKFWSLRLTWAVILLFLLIMGGIYGGIFTPTEAGGIGAFGALIISLAKRRLNWSAFWVALKDTARLTAMIIIMVIGAYSFNSFMAITQIPFTLSEFLASLPLPFWGVLAIILLFYLVCGMFFSVYAVLILTIPIFYPVMQSMDVNLIWYSVLMIRVVEVGFISPPYGMNLFGLAGIIGVPAASLYRPIIPFVIADLLDIALLAAVPLISTWLPSLM